MKDTPNISPVFERFVGWTTEKAQLPMAEFIMTDGTSNKAAMPRVTHLFDNRLTMHPSDQAVVTVAYRSFTP